MGKKKDVKLLTSILVFLIVADVSNAAFSLNFRKLADSSPAGDPNNVTDSPKPSPVAGNEKTNQTSPSSTSGQDKSKDKQVEATPPTDTEKQNDTPKDTEKQDDTPKDTEKQDDTPKDTEKQDEKPKDTEKQDDTPKDTEKQDYKPKDTEKQDDTPKDIEKQDDASKDTEKQNDASKDTVKENDTTKEGGKEQDKPPKEEVKEPDNTVKEEEVKEKDKQKDKGEKKPEVGAGENESCDGIVRRCRDEKSMVACIKSFDDVSKALALLIQNKGDSSLKVDLTFPSSGSNQEVIVIPKLKSKQVNMSLVNVGGKEIKLSAGNGHCVLHLDQGVPASEGNFFRWMPQYSKFVTPIYGAYFMLLTTTIAGGVWACCWFTKRRRHSDVPYQELEMSVPESTAVADTADGWDEVWDDDWDEEKAVKSPVSISSNGLTSRTPKKDSWEDWDD